MVHDALGLLDPAAAHHLGLVLLQALALGLFAHYAIRFLGFQAGAFAAVALMLFPSAFGHAFNNPKDWPCAMFYGLAVLAAGEGLVSGRARDILAAGLFAGISLAAKLNAVFVLATLGLWLPIVWFARIRQSSAGEKYRLTAALLAAPYIAGAVFLVSWPWIWDAPPAGMVQRLSGYLSFMAAYGISPRETWTWHPLKCLLYMTPPAVLLASLVALIAWVRRRDPEATIRVALLVIWVAVPYLRSIAPHSNFYDANRHFIEYVPGLCALAGWGFAQLLDVAQRVARRWPGPLRTDAGQRALRMALTGAAALSLLVPLLRYAPFETAYFNVFTGGLGGAQARALFRMPPPTDPRIRRHGGRLLVPVNAGGVRRARQAHPRAHHGRALRRAAGARPGQSHRPALPARAAQQPRGAGSAGGLGLTPGEGLQLEARARAGERAPGPPPRRARRRSHLRAAGPTLGPPSRARLLGEPVRRRRLNADATRFHPAGTSPPRLLSLASMSKLKILLLESIHPVADGLLEAEGFEVERADRCAQGGRARRAR